MTWDQFSEIFGMLVMQLRATDADELMARAYFKALADLEPEFLQAAAERMAKAGGAVDGDHRHWFPKTSEWRQMALTVERERIARQRAYLRTLANPLCLACDDTGWERRTDNRVQPCTCQHQRRLEVLGRRPWPALLPATPDPEQLGKVISLLKPIVEAR